MNETIKLANLRVTKTRSAILTLLQKENKPLEVSRILKLLKNKGVNPDEATVYRILEIFLTKGIVKKIHIAKFNQSLYEINSFDHHHFTCDNCGTILEINSCNLTRLIKDLNTQKHLLIKGHDLEFNGLCSKCQ